MPQFVAQLRFNLLFERQDEYNCSASSVDWSSRGTERPAFGWMCIIVSCMGIGPYLACLPVLWGLSKNACYKMMFCLAILDLGVLVGNIFGGVVFIVGGMFCHAPKTFYALSFVAVGCFFSSCCACLMIAINRFVELFNIRWLLPMYQTSQSVTTTLDMALRGLSIMGIHSVHVRTDNAAYYHCSGTIGSVISLSKSTGVKVKSWSFSEPQDGKGPADRYTGISKSKTRRLINSGMDMENQDQLITLLETAPLLKGVSFYLFDIFESDTPQTPSKIPRVTDYSHFEFGEDSIRAWKYRGIGEGVVFKDSLYSNVLPYDIIRSGGHIPNGDSAAWDLWNIKNRKKTTFWHYDPSNIGTGEVESTEEDEATEHKEDTQPTVGMKGLLFSRWCGASFQRHGDLLNHLNFGKHESHPWKITSTDLSLKYYKRCLEDTIQVKSLIPLQDFIEKIFDHSIPPLPMGWALRGAKKNAPLPEKTKKLIQAYFIETQKINKRADPEEAYRRMIADPSIPFDERMTIEQIKRYIPRLVATPIKKTVVVRGKRSNDMEVDEDGDAIEWKIEEIEIGEWGADPGCEDEEEGRGNRPWMLMTIPIMYGVFAMLCTPFTQANSEAHLFLLDPMIHPIGKYEYTSYMLVANNFISPALSSSLYLIMILKIFAKRGTMASKDSVNRAAIMVVSAIQPLQSSRTTRKVNELLKGAGEAWQKYWTHLGLKELEGLVSKSAGAYCVGNIVSIADTCVPSVIYKGRTLGVDVSEFPTLLRIEANLGALKPFASASPFYVESKEQ